MTLASGARYRIGSIDLAVVNDGHFRYDAGAILGVVPRVMWERQRIDLDEQHRRLETAGKIIKQAVAGLG